jgi:DNA polymerase I-like protein with 3'-5' exonuclease and polymerase domains/intein/homing endonuclease
MEDFLNWSEEERRPKVQKKPWMDHKKMVLGTVDNLDDIIDECIKSGRYAIDLETTGLNKNSYQVTITEGRTKDQIVGVCLSPDGNVGYYLPIRHRKGEEHNIPVSRVEKALRKLVESNSVATFHHARFDQEFLQFSGGNNPIGTWDDPKKWDDTLILTYLINTREHNKGLKHQSKVQLGFEMIEIDELFPEDHKGGYDFSELDPSWEPVLWYAASDAICTYCLYAKISPIVLKGTSERKAQDQVYLLEKMCLPATRWMERVGINIDQNVVIDLIRLGQKEFFTCLEETYDFLNANLGRKVEPGWFSLLRAKKNLDDVDFNISDQIEEFRKEAKREGMDALDGKGHYLVLKQHNGEWPEKYDILSRPQLGPLFEELEIPDLARTEKSGQVKTTQDEIDRLFQKFGDQYPFLPKIKRLGELQKALGTYLISLRRDVGPDGCLHPYYNQLGTDTGRYTTPSSDKPQLDGGTSFPVHGTPATYDTSRPACLLGIRKAVKARKGKVLAAIDFGGVELRIATNLSREPKWMKEYFHCSSCDLTFDNGDGESTPIPPPAYCPRCGSDKIGDLHTLTALAFYGEDKASTKEFKQLRQNAKCVIGNTLVLTNKGLIPIKDLNPGAKDGEQVPLEGIQVWSEHGVQPATHFWNAGVQDTVKIEVNDRYSLEGTETHRIRIWDGDSNEYAWKHMGDLQVGDWVILETPSFKELPLMDSPEAKNPWFFEGLESSKLSVEDILFLSSQGVRIEQVVSIERGREQVYDLTVPGPESFWANGFINHNSANFSLAYGGGPSALMRATGCDENEGARHHRTFNQTYSVLKQWWDDTKSFAKRHGYVATAFGRQYPLPDIKLPITPAEEPDPQKREMNRKFRAKAERNATNGPIQGCIHPEERILTSLGFLPIEELDRLGQSFMVWTGKSWSEGRVFSSGLKEVRKTTLDSGRELKTSPDHRFLTWQRGVLGWTPQSELSTGDWVAINSKPLITPPVTYKWESEVIPQKGYLFEKGQTAHNAKGFSINGNSTTMWEFLGMLYGDGSIHEEYMMVHCGEPPSHIKSEHKAEAYANSMAARLNEELGVGAIVSLRKRPEGDSRKDIWALKVHNKAFRTFCKDVLGVETQNVYNKSFPSAVWKESPENRAAFLRGYFSADGGTSAVGDSVSVRSVNMGLLKDTQALLHSLGIRSSYRPKSLRVSVLDRFKFEKMVGFNIDYKNQRLAARKRNPWEGQWNLLPPELIKCVGEVVRASSTWATLTAPEKSAVSRLMVGSGSKPQCVKYLSRVPESEAPAFLWDYLEYDWERVTTLENLEEQVGMFDIEVFDKEHAFVANGVVVHNCSADLTKLAMGLIYKEVKKRDWFEKVHMIISIHDELVFEIDKDILAEALEVFQDIMTRNKAVLQLKWPVPLTTDCEIGYDWTVKWNLKDFQARRVRSDGVQVDEKGKPDGKVWPEEFIRIFGSRYGFADLPITDSNTKQDEESTSNIQASQEPTAPYQESKGVTPSVAPLQVEKPQRGDSYVFQLRTLSIGVADRLAQVIVQCEGRGTNLLEIRTPTGEIIAPGPEKIYVNPLEFATVAKIHGLLG